MHQLWISLLTWSLIATAVSLGLFGTYNAFASTSSQLRERALEFHFVALLAEFALLVLSVLVFVPKINM